MQHKNRRKRLGLQISLVIGLLGFISVAMVGLLLSRSSSDQLAQNKGTAVAELAYQVSDKLDRGMYERLRDMRVLASLQAVRDPNVPVNQKRALLDSLKKSFPDYAFIGLTNADGTVIASADGLLQGASVAKRPWFIDTKASQKPTINDVHEALLLAKLLPNPSNEPLRFVDFSAPVYDYNNNFTGVLGSHLSFSWANDVRQSVLESTENKEGVEVYILSSDDKVLLGPTGSQGQAFNLSGINQSMTTGQYAIQKQDKKDEYLVGYAKTMGYKDYAGFGWKVVVRQPTAVAFKAVTEERKVSLIVAGAVGLLFLILSALYIRRSLKKEEELERSKDEFVSIVSHQLRTPLSAINWYSELALDDKEKLSKEQREAMESIQTSSRNMIALVNTMLNISRIELGRLRIEPKLIDINELLERNITEVKPLAKEKDVVIRFEPVPTLPQLMVDPLLVDQVVHNLLTNAIRYSRQPHATVTITAALSGQDFTIAVADNGIGIPAEAQKHLFDRFYRAENAKKVEENGSGLGLYFIRTIITQAGGTVSFKSEENKGTTFTIRIPESGMKGKTGDRGLS